jgi:hypothetical protein
MSEGKSPSPHPFELAVQEDIVIPAQDDLTPAEQQALPENLLWPDEQSWVDDIPTWKEIDTGRGIFRERGVDEKPGINNFWFYFDKDPDNLYADFRRKEAEVYGRLNVLIRHDDETIRPEYKPVRDAVLYLEDLFTDKERREPVLKTRSLDPITRGALHLTYNVMRQLYRKDDKFYQPGSLSNLVG